MTYPDDKPYPPAWDAQRRKPGSHYYRPGTLLEIVTAEDKLALYNRRVTTRALAAKYKVREDTLSNYFPGKVPKETTRDARKAKSELIAARRDYRRAVADKVKAGELGVKEAAGQLHVHPRTISRAMK